MNKVIFNDFTPLAAENSISPAEESSAHQSSADLLNIEDRDNINFASFDGDGINLLDTSLEFAVSGDRCGYVSDAVSSADQTIDHQVVIEFENGAYNCEGITFHWLQEPCRTATVTFYDEDDGIIASSELISQSLDQYFPVPAEDFVKIIIEISQTELPFQFIKLAGIDLGKEREITEFTSPIEVYHEIVPDCSDLPGSTCDFTALIIDGIIPSEHQDIFVTADGQMIGKFKITDITRISDSEYSISCDDDTVRLESAPIDAMASSTIRTVKNITDAIKSASGISVDAGEYGSDIVSGFLDADQNCRIAAAMLSFATGLFLSSAFSKRPRLFPMIDLGRMIEADQIAGDALFSRKAEPSKLHLVKYDGSFDSIDDAREISNPNSEGGNISVSPYEDYSMMNDIDDKAQELANIAFNTSEVNAAIFWSGEKIGEKVKIVTKYDGIKEGIIKAMDLSIDVEVIASITIATR